MSPRETIYQALFNLAVYGTVIAPASPPANFPWKTFSRRLVHWTDVPAAMQPAIYVTQVSEDAKFTHKLPTIWSLNADIYMYANTGGDQKQVPASFLNPLVDQLVANLLPNQLTGEQTLGGLVEYCRIDGSIITDEGALGDQAVVVIPVKLYLPQ